jgi:hypothetical protein
MHLDFVPGVVASSKMKPVAVEDTEIPKLLDDLIELLVQEEVEVDDGTVRRRFSAVGVNVGVPLLCDCAPLRWPNPS